MSAPRPMRGRFRAVIVESSQEAWRFDVSSITGAATAQASGEAHAPLQPDPIPMVPPRAPAGRDVAPVIIKRKPPAASGHQSDANGNTDRVLTPSDDDDDFMSPLPRAPLSNRTNIPRQNAATVKPAKEAIKYARPPMARCAPSIFNSFVDHLTMHQRKRIIKMGFGGLMQIAAEGLESRDLLKFLMDRLNPSTMEIDIGQERPLRVTPFAVKKVFDIPLGKSDTPLPAKSQATQALIDFRKEIGVEHNAPVKSDYLQMLLETGKVGDDMAIRFFFIMAFNKLLFPDTSNNIRGKDAFMTADISGFRNMNWCKALVDNLRDAGLTWHMDKNKEGNKSISGCSIFLLIFYLDNLRCHHQIDHTDTPRAKFFDKIVIDEIKKADKTKDKDGKVTFGKLHLRNIINTCYYRSKPTLLSQAPPAAEPSSPTHYPSIQAELGGLVAQIVGTTRKREASQALASFDSQSENALNYIKKGHSMLLDAHHEVIRSLRQTLEKEVHGNICEDTDQRPATRRKNFNGATTSHATQLPGNNDGVFMEAGNGQGDSIHDVGPSAASLQPETMDAEAPNNNPRDKDDALREDGNGQADSVHHGNTPAVTHFENNRRPLANDEVPAQQNNGSSYEDTIMDVDNERAHENSLFPTDVTIDRIIPPVKEGGPTGPTSPMHSPHGRNECATSSLDAIIDTIEASTDQVLCPDLHAANFHPIATLRQEPVVAFSNGQDDSANNSPKPAPPHNESHQLDKDGAGNDVTDINTYQVQGNIGTGEDHLGPVLMRPCTQEDNQIRAPLASRPKRLTSVPAKYVSPFKGTLARPKIPKTKAIAVRQKFCKSLKSSSEIFITVGGNVFTGEEIFQSFGDNDESNMLESRFMSAYIKFLTYDEQIHMPDGGGYRVFLSQELGERINIDEHEEDLEWPVELAERILKRNLLGFVPHKVKLFFLPVLELDQWSVYCINMMHDRIDILDSSATDHTVYHEVLHDRIIPRLNALFQQVTNGGVKDFGKWKSHIRRVPQQTRENESGFLSAKLMDLWNGEALETQIIPKQGTQIKSEMLFYMLYHPLNEKKKLPAGLEAYRPRY